KLRDTVLSQDEFIDAASKQFELVQLHVGRDDQAIRSLQSPRVATCVLLSGDGDAYGQLRYRVYGPKGYLRALQKLRVQRASTVVARQLVRAYQRDGGCCCGAAFEAMLTALSRSAARPEARFAADVLAVGVQAALAGSDREDGIGSDVVRQSRVSRVMLTAGYTAPLIRKWVRRLDPENVDGLLELTLLPAFRDVRDDASVRVALANLDRMRVHGLHDLVRMKPVLVSAVRMAAGRLGDRNRAVLYGDELQPLLVVAPDAAIAQLLASLR
ncbi:MAG: hypothetical protein ACI9SE_003368, partial [Neolewinella sp.]